MTETDVSGGRAESDDDLRSLLREWHVVAPLQLDQRVLAAYRRQVAGRSVLSRAWRSRVAMPVPALAGLLLALGLALAFARQGTRRSVPAEPRATVRIVVATRSLAGFRPITAADRLGPRTERGR